MADKIQVFISYAREDQTNATRLFEELKKRNIDVWLDKESLLPGQKWRTEIRKAIRSSRYFIVMLSSRSVTKRGVVQKEIKEALDALDEFPENEIFVIPVRINPCEPSNEKLSEIQWVDMFPEWEKGLEKILRAMSLYKKHHFAHLLSNAEEEARALLVEARGSTNKDNSMYALRKSKDLCKRIIKEGNAKGYGLITETLSELAKITNLPSERYKLWKDCLSEAFKGTEKFDDPSLADVLGSKAVDFIQDQHIVVPLAEVNRLSADVKKNLDHFIDKLESPERGQLLSRKSALLRNMTRFRATRMAQEKISQEALRCAEKAAKENLDSWYAYLELGLSFWHVAQFEKGDEAYHSRLKSAEDSFWQSITNEPVVYSYLALTRYFRLTYQTTPFLECFDIYAMKEYNKRRFLEDAYVYGEVVLQLWYSGYPTELTENRLKDAERLLEESINAGYDNARNIVDLAFIKAARGEIDVGVEIVQTLHSLSRDTSWAQVARLVSDIGPGDDLITRGFALGITDSSIWNKLGTFAIDFLQNIPLGISIYKEALHLNPSNAVAMTNLARALLYMDTPAAIREANVWISKAASCADRRFRWWRNVREQVNEKSITLPGQPQQKQKLGKHLRLRYLSDLLRSYRLLKTVEDPQLRGYELEKLINRLFKISLGNSFSSYRTSTKWVDSPSMQIDAAFSFFDRDFYRVETKWTSSAVKPKDIVLFREKLDAVGVKGLFISISGFTNEAIQKAYESRKERQILLMDGEELESILQGYPSLDEAIRLKQIYFARESNPYFKIETSVQVEAHVNG